MAPFAFIVHHGAHTDADVTGQPMIYDCMKAEAIGIKNVLEQEGVQTFVDDPNLLVGTDAHRELTNQLLQSQVILDQHRRRTCQHVVTAPTAQAEVPHQQQLGPHSLPQLIMSLCGEHLLQLTLC